MYMKNLIGINNNKAENVVINHVYFKLYLYLLNK